MEDDAVRRFRTQMKLLQRRLRHELLPVRGLSRSALQVLSGVSRSPGIAPRAVADELRMTSSNVAAALRELEAAGLVARTRDAKDGRRVHILITEAGADLVADYRTERDSWLGRAIHTQLTAREQQLLVHASELLERLAQFETVSGIPSPTADAAAVADDIGAVS